MKIVTSLYGDKYVSLLLAFLESIYQNVKSQNLEIYIFWSDVDEKLLEPLKEAYPLSVFIQLESVKNIDNSSTGNYFSSLKSGKMAYLNTIYDHLEEGEQFVLIDCDTIVLKDISEVFNHDFDIAFTSLPLEVNVFPVNVGIMFFRNSAATRKLTANMQQHITKVVEDEQLHNESFAKYGAADQAALCRIIDFESDDKIEEDLKLTEVKTLELDWYKYNNFSSVESFANISILHLKGSWQTIIFKGRPLQSIKHKKDKALKVYLLYLNLFSDAISRTYSYTMLKSIGNKLGVKIPFFVYSDKGLLKIRRGLYILFQLPERFYRYFTNRGISFLSKSFEKLIFKHPKKIYQPNKYKTQS